jgi:ribonuclease HII
MRYLIGIDEAGRGALAGPVCVGAVLYPHDFDWREAFALITKKGKPRLRDSKQLSPQQREILFEYIAEHGRLRHAAAFVDAKTIDEIGIANAARQAAAVALSELRVSPEKAQVLLDAGLGVSDIWKQESFVRGDERVPAIAFASIVAKVLRDRVMEDYALEFERYFFDVHKGYGTLRHRQAIRIHGLSVLHRATFCSRLPRAHNVA